MSVDVPPASGPRNTINERIAAAGAGLTRAESKVADLLVADPTAAAFATVAEIAEAAGVGVATVMRCATRLGFGGYGELQAAAQAEMIAAAVPAVERLRRHEGSRTDTARRRPGAIDLANMERTFAALDIAVVDEIAARIADAATVFVIAGDAAAGVARQIASELAELRPEVVLLDGNPVDIARRLASLTDRSVVLCLDTARYDVWVVDTVRSAYRRRAWIAALTDHPLSPLARVADRVVIVQTASTSPFDSYVAALAVASEIVAGVAARRRATAVERLDAYEAAYRSAAVLIDREP